ncbi:hypothetical protein Aduo_007889 [Ancylostoma duodenale]
MLFNNSLKVLAVDTLFPIVFGFCDIIGNFAVEWAKTDRKAGFGPSVEMFTRVMYTFTGVTFFTHLIGSLLMTVNRYVAVCFPLAYGKIWTSKNVYIMLLVDVIVCFAVHAHVFFIRLVYEGADNGWTSLGRENQIPVVRAISSCAAIIYGCISSVLISRTFYVMLKFNKKSKQCQRKGLVIFVTIDCLLWLIDCIYETADLLGLSAANVVFVWISDNSYGWKLLPHVEESGTPQLLRPASSYQEQAPYHL